MQCLLWLSFLSSLTIASCDTNIRVVLLRGTPKEMGIEYGQSLRQELVDTLAILVQFAQKRGASYSSLAAEAELFHARYVSSAYDLFLTGIAKGSGLSKTDVKFLNGMETLSLRPSSSGGSKLIGACAFLFVPPARTLSALNGIVARNYDYPKPFDAVAQTLVVAILSGSSGGVSSAIVGLPGQIYCPSCLNEAGLFMALNNGGPSGGFYVEQARKSLLINMLQFMQQSNTLESLRKQLLAAQTDYSLIVNVADGTSTSGLEYSSAMGMRPFVPAVGELYVSTNFYLNDTWTGVPVPTDEKTWQGVTRRRNLLALANATARHTTASVLALMEKRIADGGAVANSTIYQMVLDVQGLVLHLRSMHQAKWTTIDMAAHFRKVAVDSIESSWHAWTVTAAVFIGLFVLMAIALVALGVIKSLKQ